VQVLRFSQGHCAGAGAEVQRCRGAEVQWCRGAELYYVQVQVQV